MYSSDTSALSMPTRHSRSGLAEALSAEKYLLTGWTARVVGRVRERRMMAGL